jgi:nitric oxide dioxygenase
MSTPHRTPETSTLDVQLLLSSFLKIEPQADDFATSFYQILFHKYPKVQSLFSETDMEKQKDKLLQSLQMVMGNVNNPEAFTSILKNLGKRHVAYGAVLTDYPLIGDALLQALEKHLGKDWTDEVKQTWTLAYQTIAETMLIRWYRSR